MKIFKTQEEVEKEIKNSVLLVEGDVRFECPIQIKASINIAGDILAENISAEDISAKNISVQGNITARNITVQGSISAKNIFARNISARDVSYHTFCRVYKSLKCHSIKATRLDGELKANESI